MMERRLTKEQLGQVVAEVTRLKQFRDDEQRETFDREQVAEVLKELDLPVELLDDAMAQLQRREALAREQRRKPWIIAAIVLAIFLLSAGAIAFWTLGRDSASDRISADQARITRVADDGGNLQTVTRDGQQVYYRVTLRDVQPGDSLSLKCDWITPDGKVFRQNAWTTSPHKSVWDTYCRCQIGPAAPKGEWKVEMSLGDRVLSSTTFQVE
ncbi:MAG TPA: DUF3859 domain-containing protein [Blastocatellia bacterium]|nr:DUF3859 domain-containing protein [Blastocatellia bacterium]